MGYANCRIVLAKEDNCVFFPLQMNGPDIFLIRFGLSIVRHTLDLLQGIFELCVDCLCKILWRASLGFNFV